MEPILDKLKEHDGQFVVITNKLKEHDEQLDRIATIAVDNQKKLKEHDAQFISISRKFDDVDTHLDRIDEHIVLHTERLDRIEENMATKADIEHLTTTLDELVGLARKKDQELVFMSERVSRVETDVAKMKPMIGLT